jgi:very-short-patch-repair endonuclease
MATISNRARKAADFATLAERQEGLISRRQLDAIAISPGQIKRWVRDGHLRPVFHGVFVTGHGALGPRARIRAAALACPGAVISHRSAAALLGFGRVAPVTVDLIPLEQGGRKIDGIKAHRVPHPGPAERTLVHGIPCTSPARTVVDLAGAYGEVELGKTVEGAATEGLLAVAAIDAILATGPKRRGAPCLRRVLAHWRPVAETAKHATFRSLFEAKLLPLIADAALPLPRFNAPVHTAERVLEVDLLWPAERFILEADSRKHHGAEIAFERDRRRDRELLAARHTVLRVTWREVEEEPDAVLSVIRDELLRRSELKRRAR